MSKVIRIWHGTARRENADDYARHVEDNIFPQFAQMKGNLGAKVLRREVEDGVEFLVMTTWDSLEAIKEFSPDDLNQAVVAENAQPFFLRYDDQVSHFSLACEMGV